MAKYNKQTVEAICAYIRDGDSQKLACKKAGIGDSTFHDWIKAKPEFAERIKKAKDEFLATITGKLEATLWKRAMGYEVTETDTEYVSDSNGNPKIKSQRTKVKHIQPDTGALIFALTNVAPEEWEKTKLPGYLVEKLKASKNGYGWFVKNPRRVIEFPVKGQLGIFNLVFTKDLIFPYRHN